MKVNAQVRVDFQSCLFQSNSALPKPNGGNWARGGAMWSAGAGALIENCRFYDNSAKWPGGSALYGSRMRVITSVFRGNSGSSASLHLESGCYLFNNTFLAAGVVDSLNWNTYVQWECHPGQWMSPSATEISSGVEFNGCMHKCGEGTFGILPNLKSALECTACPTGHYCQGQGLSAGTPCPAGTRMPSVGARSSMGCLPCGAGRFNPSVGQADCQVHFVGSNT